MTLGNQIGIWDGGFPSRLCGHWFEHPKSSTWPICEPAISQLGWRPSHNPRLVAVKTSGKVRLDGGALCCPGAGRVDAAEPRASVTRLVGVSRVSMVVGGVNLKPSSFLLLVVRPGAPSSVIVPEAAEPHLFHGFFGSLQVRVCAGRDITITSVSPDSIQVALAVASCYLMVHEINCTYCWVLGRSGTSLFFDLFKLANCSRCGVTGKCQATSSMPYPPSPRSTLAGDLLGAILQCWQEGSKSDLSCPLCPEVFRADVQGVGDAGTQEANGSRLHARKPLPRLESLKMSQPVPQSHMLGFRSCVYSTYT